MLNLCVLCEHGRWKKMPKKLIRIIERVVFVALIQKCYNILIYHGEEMSASNPAPHSPQQHGGTA